MTTDAMVPSYRVPREPSGLPWRMFGIAGGLLAGVVVGAGGWWAWQQYSGPRTIPVVEADPRPFKVRPDDPGGLRVPNQGELILERPSSRAQAVSQAGHLAPAAEAPNLERLRAALTAAQPAPAPAAAPSAPPPAAEPAAAAAADPASAALPPPPPPAPQAEAAPAAAPPAERPRTTGGHVTVQLGALSSEEGARSEWARLNRLAPDLLQGRSPQIVRFEREGRPPLFRLRTGGLPDTDAAAEFCEKVRAKRGNCSVVRS